MSTDSDLSTVPCLLEAGVGIAGEVAEEEMETDLDFTRISDVDEAFDEVRKASSSSSSSSASSSSLDFSRRCAAAATVKQQNMSNYYKRYNFIMQTLRTEAGPYLHKLEGIVVISLL